MKKCMIVIFSIISLMGCSQSNELTIEGRLSVKGNTPHSYLVIEDRQSHQDYKINNAKAFHLGKRQNEVIKIKAKVIKQAVGPGFPAVIEVLEVN